jgi:tetratricopeptide (TPR) repeat protein
MSEAARVPWQEKLDYLLAQEAVLASPAQRFELAEQIKECRAKLAELADEEQRCSVRLGAPGAAPFSPMPAMLHDPLGAFGKVPDAATPIAGNACVYASPGMDGDTHYRPAFAPQTANCPLVWATDPYRARLVRQALDAPDAEVVGAVWKAMDPREQMALALVRTAIYLSKRPYLECLLPEYDWAGMLPGLEREQLVESQGTGFFHPAERIRGMLDQEAGLLDRARARWMQVLTEHQGFWDLDMARCLHLITAGDREQAVEIAHATILDLEDAFPLELYGNFFHQLDTRKFRRSLSRLHQSLLDDAIGIHHVRLGQYPEATHRFRAMLKRGRRIGDDWTIVEALLHLGRTAHAAGDDDSAAGWYDQAINEARSRGETFLLGRALHNLSQCMVRVDPDRARALLAESTEVKQQTGDGSPVALWMASGLIAAESGDPATALKCFRKAEAAVGRDGYRERRAQALLNQANALGELGRSDEGLRTGAEALALARECADAELLRLTVQGQAVRLSQHGHNREALALFEELAELKAGIGDRADQAVALSDGAVMRLRLGDSDGAIQRFVEARHLAEAAGAERETAFVLRNHAWALRERGDAEAAFRLLSRGYDSASEGARWHLAIKLARELADDSRRSGGAIEETDNWYRKAIAAARQAGDLESQAFLMTQRFACLRDADRHADADAALRELLGVTRSGKGLVVEHAAARSEAGNLCAARGDLDKACEHYHAGLKVLEGHADRRQRALLLGNLGETERRRGNLEAAEQHIRKGLELVPVDDSDGRFHALHNLALVLADRGQVQDAVTMLERIRERAKKKGDWETHAKAWLELGSIAWSQDRPGLSTQRWQRAFDVAQSHGLARWAAMAALGLARVQLERGNLDAAAGVLSKLRLDPPGDLAADLAGTHAEIMVRQERLEQAAVALQQGIALAPRVADQALLRSHLARIYGEQDRFDNAWAALETAFALAEDSATRREVFLHGIDLALRQDGETLREDGRTEALFARIRKDPDCSMVAGLSYALAERLWKRDPEGASVVHFVTMTERLPTDTLDNYLASGFRLFHRLIEQPDCHLLRQRVQARVTLNGSESDQPPLVDKLYWPFRMAERYLSRGDASVAPTGDHALALFEAVWQEQFCSENSGGSPP